MGVTMATDGNNEERCPHCDCPNRHCACVLRGRVEFAEQGQRDALKRAAQAEALYNAAASCLRYNADRLRKPRGEDERRLLEHAKATYSGFDSGRTDGRLEFLEAPPQS